MTQVISDPTLVSQLRQTREPVDLYDESGGMLGTFFPRATAADYEAAERARPKLSEEELARRETGPTFTTAEAIRYLESL
jgi:hypothetical protein